MNANSFTLPFRCGLLLLLGMHGNAATHSDGAAVVLSLGRSQNSHGLVDLSFTTPAGFPGWVYRLYQSRDLKSWSQYRTGIAPAGGVRLSLPMDEGVYVFFRLEILPVWPLENLVWIAPGSFVMGSPPDEVGRFLDKEEPQTRVALTRGYWMSRCEVTQGEFAAVMGFNPSLFTGDPQRPVEDVTWFDAVSFGTRLTARERANGRLPEGAAYRLPTEAEWEYAARAGTTTRFSHGDDPGYEWLRFYAWYGGNSGLRTHPVGSKLANPWGLFDMHGNVFEWCSDWFGPLPGDSVIDPHGPATGIDRIIRSGYWDSSPAFCRSAMRVHFPPSTRISYLGFRVVLAKSTGDETDAVRQNKPRIP